MKLIDSHAHVTMDAFDDDREQVLERANAAGVVAFIEVGIDLAASERALAFARSHENVWCSVGVHPHASLDVHERSLARLREWGRDETCVAIGETGLDYFKCYSPKNAQRRAFEAHLQLAADLDLPVIVHNRNASNDCHRILKKFEGVRGVMHCFSGGPDDAERFLSLGFYISFAGQITYPKADPIRNACKTVPAEKLLIETDCPFLAPQKVRGKRNEPAFVVHTAEQVAELRGVSVEEIAELTARNVETLFGVSCP